MKYSFIVASIFLVASPVLANAKDGTVSATEGWNNSAGFQTSYDKLVKLTTAEAIERKKGGFYDQWQQNNLYISNTSIGVQSNIETGDVGSLFVTETNCGPSVSQLPLDSGGTNDISVGDVGCIVGTNNANTP